MKKLFLLAGMLLSTVTFAQKADDVLGKWLSENKDAQIEVFKRSNRFYGKIVWLQTPLNQQGTPKLDVENPENSLKKRPVMGLEILQDFTFDKDEWSDGTIYDPKEGKEYSCVMTMPNINQLDIRGYIGISLIGRTSAWKRVK